MKRVDNISSNLTFSTNRLEVPLGKMTLGTGIDHNTVFKNVVVGSAYTQGNVIRSVYDLNGNGVLLYNATENDVVDQIRRYNTIFDTHPTLIDFPYLTVPAWNPETVISNSSLYPIYKLPGKGLGQIEWLASANRLDGNETEAV